MIFLGWTVVVIDGDVMLRKLVAGRAPEDYPLTRRQALGLIADLAVAETKRRPPDTDGPPAT